MLPSTKARNTVAKPRKTMCVRRILVFGGGIRKGKSELETSLYRLNHFSKKPSIRSPNGSLTTPRTEAPRFNPRALLPLPSCSTPTASSPSSFRRRFERKTLTAGRVPAPPQLRLYWGCGGLGPNAAGRDSSAPEGLCPAKPGIARPFRAGILRLFSQTRPGGGGFLPPHLELPGAIWYNKPNASALSLLERRASPNYG